jgi:hypothetical protein
LNDFSNGEIFGENMTNHKNFANDSNGLTSPDDNLVRDLAHLHEIAETAKMRDKGQTHPEGDVKADTLRLMVTRLADKSKHEYDLNRQEMVKLRMAFRRDLLVPLEQATNEDLASWQETHSRAIAALDEALVRWKRETGLEGGVGGRGRARRISQARDGWGRGGSSGGGQ